jgi:hypothetical protein
LEVAKVNGKTPNFHSFLGISSEIRLFSLVFAGFCLEDAILAAFFLDEREKSQARNHAIPARTTRPAEAERGSDLVRHCGRGTARACGQDAASARQ